MQINTLSDDYSVSPQIDVSDVPSIVQAGFKSVICNRPDQENPEPRQTGAIKAAVQAAGMEFAENVFDPSSFGPDKIERQAELLAQLPSPVFAYCASGNRSSIVWALALAGRVPTDDLINAGAQYGYQAGQFRELIDRLALQE